MAVVPGLGRYLGSARIRRFLGDSPTALILHLAPVYTMTKAWLLVWETLRAYHFAGATPILLGIFLSTRR